ncbi:MAG: CheR family methyltransferase [Terriglobales bacterium]
MHNAVTSPITPRELSEIRSFIEQRSGMAFDESRARFFTARVVQHMAAKSISGGPELLRVIKNSNSEYDALLERVLTQETSFFRYPEMFRAFETSVLPRMQLRKRWSEPRTLRVWSAGCSTGEEPYSIAMSISDALEFSDTWDIQILATDVSRRALQAAEAGRYSRRALASLKPERIAAHFTPNGDEYVVRPKLREWIDFVPLNLAQMIYMGRFDCIFCMNVLIYFSAELRVNLIRRFARYLEPGGYLFLGHAESAANARVELDPRMINGSLIYQKPELVPAGEAGQRS